LIGFGVPNEAQNCFCSSPRPLSLAPNRKPPNLDLEASASPPPRDALYPILVAHPARCFSYRRRHVLAMFGADVEGWHTAYCTTSRSMTREPLGLLPKEMWLTCISADMREHFVIDPLISKRQQLLLATQLCRMVLKVSSNVSSHTFLIFKTSCPFRSCSQPAWTARSAREGGCSPFILRVCFARSISLLFTSPLHVTRALQQNSTVRQRSRPDGVARSPHQSFQRAL
jgi:hypothetical protein